MVDDPDGWRTVGWADAGRAVEELAAGFLAIGIRPGDRVAIVGATRLEWTLTDFALLEIGAVVVPAYPAAAAADRAHVLGHAGVRVVVCDDGAQRERIAHLQGLADLERIITMDDSDDDLRRLREQGRYLLAHDDGAVRRAGDAVRAEDLASLVYTSGTTGLPKGCMLTHRNHAAMAVMAGQVDGLTRPGDVVLLHLPLAHVFARLIPMLAAHVGMTVAFCPEVGRLGGSLTAVHPTILPSVPRVFETMHAAVLREIRRSGGPRRHLAESALTAGRQAVARRQEGRPLGVWRSARLRVADRLVFAPIRTRFGGQVRHAVSGAAALQPQVAETFEALGIPILEGYGLTECTTVVAVNRPDLRRIGTVGPAVPGIEIRIADDGEILVRGDTVFAGYYRDHAATEAVLDDDGWLRTGDLGSLDADGLLTIIERKKDLIVTSAGDNVAPQRIETALCASPYVADALVFGDGRPYLVALLVASGEALRSAGPGSTGLEGLLAPAVTAANRDAAPAERVRAFAVLPRPLRIDAGELTPTLKPRRQVCAEHFGDLIASLYSRTGAPPD